MPEFVVWRLPSPEFDSKAIVGAARRANAIEATLAVWQHSGCNLPLHDLIAEPRGIEDEWQMAVEANRGLPGPLNLIPGSPPLP